MNRSRVSAAVVMLILCLLPLLGFYVLAFLGIEVSPFLVMMILILSCMAMMHLMMGSDEQTSCHGHAETNAPNEIVTPAAFPSDVSFDDVFRTTSTENVGEVLVLQGELIGPADDVSIKLQNRLQGSGFTALLKEDEFARTQIVLLPVELDQVDTKTDNNWINLGLFVATIVTTTWAGALHQGANIFSDPSGILIGLPYSLGLMLILGAHELGHYFAARAHGMKVTLPYFIPIPFALGTFGAFIRLKSPSHSRRALFDVGVAGPLAGLVFAIPALLFGLTMSSVVPAGDQTGQAMMHGGADVGSSILLTVLAKLSMGDAITHGHVLALHPLAFAGWLGLLVTALNLLPIGQLDGGHISDAMFGTRRSASISSAALFTLFFLGLFVWSGLLFWAFIAWFIAGSKGLPPLNDITRLDPIRYAIGVFSFVLLFAILIPVPHAFWETLGIHCPYL